MVFVVLHYNAIMVTEQCIESIQKLKGNENIKIVVVDNNSPDHSGEILEKKYDKCANIDVILNKSNLGFSAGNNIGYKYVKKKYQTKFMIFCNNDIVFNDCEFINKVKETYKKSKFYVMGPDIYSTRSSLHQSPLYDISTNILRVDLTIIYNKIIYRLHPIYWNLIKMGKKKISTYENKDLHYKENVTLMGACLIFSDKFIRERDNVFEPETFLYYEEFLLVNWCRYNRKKIVFNPDIQVLHNEGIATETTSKSEKQKNKNKIGHIINAAKIYRKQLIALKRK